MSLVFYKQKDGTKPAGKFINSLNTNLKAKVVRDLDLLEKYGFDLVLLEFFTFLKLKMVLLY